MEKNKISSYVGFAVKKGSALFGVDNVIASRRRPFLILIDSKLSDRSKRRIQEYSENNCVPVDTCSLQEILPNRNCLCLGITDENLAQAIKNVKKEI